jgi:hypothetical protein
MPKTNKLLNNHGKIGMLPKRPMGRSFLNGGIKTLVSKPNGVAKSPVKAPSRQLRSRGVSMNGRDSLTESYSQPPIPLKSSSLLMNAPTPVRKL